ncbi:hypothetical protein ABG067_004964 [Albugo candida]
MARVPLVTAKPRRCSPRLAPASRLRQQVTPVRNQQRVSVQDENPSPATECTEANAGSTESFPKKVIKEKAALARKSRLQTLRSRKVAKKDAKNDVNRGKKSKISQSTTKSSLTRTERRSRKLPRRSPPQEDNPLGEDVIVKVPHISARKKAAIWAKRVLESEPDCDKPLEVATTESKASLSLSREKSKPVEEVDVSQMSLRELALSISSSKCKPKHEEIFKEEDDHSEIENFDGMDASHQSASTCNDESALMAPQVQIIDGKMVITQALVQHKMEPNKETITEERQQLETVRSKRWGKEETKQFYYCLSQTGPTFSMMEPLFPSRSRLELKKKFKSEEKLRPRLIEIALRASVAPLDGEIVKTISQLIKKASEVGITKTVETSEEKCDDKDIMSDDGEAVHNLSVVSLDQSEELESSFDFGS